MARGERTYPASAEQVSAARTDVIELARRSGVPEGELDGVRLAVSEAMSNAVVHGHRDGRPGEITVMAEASDHEFRVEVADGGCGMSPHLGSPGAGLGLPLIAELTDSMSIRPAGGGGTVLCMTFALPVPVG
jgi:stage II sporulation protein AB (anti-sigma F factor)